MRRSLLAAVVIFATASVALAATGDKPQRVTLLRAVAQTNGAGSLRYVMTIAVAQQNHPAAALRIHGTRGPRVLFVHVKLSTATSEQEESALLDGPFLYEGAPNGIAVYGNIRWLRIPVASLSPSSKALTSIRNLSPAPLLRVLAESSLARRRMPSGFFYGKLAYDDAIVHTALSGMAGGIEFRKVRYTARVGTDGFVHAIRVIGKTADGSRTLTIGARLYGFGLRVDLKPPPEGTFMDRKLLNLAE
jgi:hypothetical protein